MKKSQVVGSMALLLGSLTSVSCTSDDGAGSLGSGNTGSGSSAGTSASTAGSGNGSGGTSSGNSSGAGASSVGSSGGTSSGNPPGGTSGSGSQQGGRNGGGSDGGGPNGSGGKPPAGAGCDSPGLQWKTGAKTNFESYPEPGSEECIEFNGCEYLGEFSFCDGKKSEDWVSEHSIVAVFPADGLEGHDLCLKKGDKTIVVTVLDTCGDSDCDGCCTENRGDADALIDLEKYTNERWGVDDGEIQFADLGANPDSCD
jgi:hypothetical protein